MRPIRLARRALVTCAVLGAAGAGAAALAQSPSPGRIGPALGLLPDGRHLSPYGRLVGLGNFPTGGRLTPDGRFLWAVDTGEGINDVRIVSVRSGRVIQVLRLPGASGGVALDPRHALAYVSGVPDSSHADQRSPAGTPGIDGDVVHVFAYDRRSGLAHFVRVLAVPPPAGTLPPQSFPPTNTKALAWPDRLAISPDGSRLLVPLNLAAAAAIVDVSTGAVRYVSTGDYPYGAAILPDGRTGLVSNEAPGTVSVVDLDSASKLTEVQVGPPLSHPEAIAVDPAGKRAYVALANSDQVAVIDLAGRTVERTLSVERPQGLGASPVDLAVTPDGRRLVVADEGTDDLAVFRLPGGGAPVVRTAGRSSRRAARRRAAHRRRARHRRRSAAFTAKARRGRRAAAQPPAWTLEARIPTAEMPMAVAVAATGDNPCGFAGQRSGGAHCMKLVYVSGKDLGTGPNPGGPQPDTPQDSDDRIAETQYLPLLNIGAAGIGDFPSAARLASLTPVAVREITPVNAGEPAPPGTPLRPNGPIKHVFYIVRENRTYDQVLGDDPRGDGDPKLTLFGQRITPNAHALADRFGIVDHVYANSEASIDGHFWTSAAKVSDYVHKAWYANYAGRQRPYDFGVYAITWPGNGFLFDQAERQGISYFNYGEAIAGTVPLTDRDRSAADTAEVARKFANSDLGQNDAVPGSPTGCYPNDASIGHDAINGLAVYDTLVPPGAATGSVSRFACFQTHFETQLATNSVPAFNYLVLSNDHTDTLQPGQRTPFAMVADNDEGLGRIVDLISHSPIWSSSAIFVVEDDSQDGADHVDAHRIPALVISPYTKPGQVVHTRYDFLSVIRSIELILGMKPLGLFDAVGTPMYDAFSSTPQNSAPYDYIPAQVSLTDTNPSGTAGAALAARLPSCLDCISQRQMDALLWKYVHGQNAVPPPPGPDASAQDAGARDAADGAAATAAARSRTRSAR